MLKRFCEGAKRFVWVLSGFAVSGFGLCECFEMLPALRVYGVEVQGFSGLGLGSGIRTARIEGLGLQAFPSSGSTVSALISGIIVELWVSSLGLGDLLSQGVRMADAAVCPLDWVYVSVLAVRSASLCPALFNNWCCDELEVQYSRCRFCGP